MRKLLVYLKEYKKECFWAPLFKMLEASFELFVPLVIASMIDNGIGADNKNYVIKCCAVLIFLAVVGLISAVSAQFFAAKAAVGFAAKLREKLFEHLLGLSFKEYDDIGSSTMITRMTSDVMLCQNGVNLFLRLMLRSPFVVFGAMIMAFTIDYKAAMIFVLVIIILSFVVALIMRSNIPLLEKAQGLLDKVLLHTRENLLGVRVIRAFSREKLEKEEFDNRVDDLYNGQLLSAKISSLMNPITYVVINMAIVVLIYVGAIRVDQGIISGGSVVALYNYMSQILVELIKLANMIVTTSKAIASGNRISNVLEITNSQDNSDITNLEKLNRDIINNKDKSTQELAVEFSNVSFKYNEGGDNALNDISFEAYKGEIIGVIGGTGAGKSTLVNLIPRFYDASQGKVKVFGIDVCNQNQTELRNKIGVVFQKASLFAGSIADNLKIAKMDATEAEMLEAIDLSVATDIIKVKKEGLEAQVGEAGKELSGGQKQRLTIARALIRKPQILILDDSTSALDFETSARFIKNLRNLTYQPTIFIVSQRTNAMLEADKILVLEDGNIIATGKHSELLKTCDIYREIHETQFGVDKSEAGGKNE